VENVIEAKFHCPHALAYGSQCISIMGKTPEFSSVLYLHHLLGFKE